MPRLIAVIAVCIGFMVLSDAFKFQKFLRPSTHVTANGIPNAFVALKSALPSLLVAATLIMSPGHSYSAVGEGDLPPGPLAQAKILKLKVYSIEHLDLYFTVSLDLIG